MDVTKHAVILPSGHDSYNKRIAGLTPIQRLLLTLHRAGVTTATVIDAPADTWALGAWSLAKIERTGLQVNCVAARDWRAPDAKLCVFVPDDIVVTTAAANTIASATDNDITFSNGDSVVAFVTVDPSALSAVSTFAALLPHCKAARDGGEVFARSVSTQKSATDAEDALFRSMLHPTDGFVAAHINKKISFFISRRVLRLPITPNQITLFNAVLASIGAWLVFHAAWWSLAVGVFLVQMQSVLDGCDGEVARLKLMTSKFGEWLDNVLDDGFNSLLGVSLGFATAHLLDQPIYRWLGCIGAACFIFYNAVVYTQLARVHHSGHPLHFRWWFQNDDDDASEAAQESEAEPMGIGKKIVHFVYTVFRRDFYLFVFMWLAIARLPEITIVWYLIMGVGSAGLAATHLASGGYGRAVRHARTE